MLRFRFSGLRIWTCRKGVITQEDQDSRRHDSAGDPSPARLENAACHGTRDQSYYWGRTRKETRGAPLPPCRETAPGRLLSRTPPAPVPHTQRKARGSLRSVPPPCAPGSAVGGARHRKPTSCHLPHNACPITPGTLRIHDSECQKGRPRRDSKNEALTRLRISFQERFPSRRGRAPPDLLSGVRPRAVDSTPSKEEKGSRGGTSPVRRTPGL